MAFKREIQALVGINNSLAVDIASLNISFDIMRSFDIEDNSASLSIYNAKEDTRKKVLTKGNDIILKAGYEDEGGAGQIFAGIITESTSRKNGTEWVSEIVATDFASNSENLLKETVSLSYASKSPISSVINDLIGIMGVPISGLQNASSVILNNGFVFSGYIKDAIREVEAILKANDIGVYFDNSEMVIYRLGIQDSSFGIVRVTENSGLVGEVEDITDDSYEDGKKRLAFTSLLNWKIKPNALVNLSTQKTSGTFIVERVNFVGDNMGGDFFAKCEVVE